MGTRTSPELAQELLVGATPGPWKLIGEYDDGEPRPDTSCLIHTHDGKYLGIMHGADAHLAAAAPDLAETIAGMEYEYAVQFKHGDTWEFENAERVGCLVDDLFSEDPQVAFWWRDKDDAQRFAASAPETTTRVVRRLVSAPEVVE